MENNTYSMKWFKFLIYFALFAGAVLNLIGGVGYLTGSIYYTQSNGQVTAEMIYAIFGDLKPIDMIYGITMIFMAVFAVITRFMLAGYKKIGPTFVTILYVIGLVAPIIYIAMASMATGLDTSDLVTSSASISFVISIVMIVANSIYFKKRAELFVN